LENKKASESRVNKKKIKILYISRTSKFTGAENILLDIVKYIDKKVFHPIVVLPDSRGLFYKRLVQSQIDTVIVRMPFLRITYNPFLMLWFVINIIIVNIIFLFAIARWKIDIVICHTIQESFYLSLPTKLMRKKLIICFKNILNKKWKKYIRARLAGLFADKIIAVSKKTMEDFTRFNPERVNIKKAEVVYDCLNYKEYIKNIRRVPIGKFLKRKKGDFIIVNIGNLTELKGQELLVKSVSGRKLKDKNIKILLIGDVYDKKDLIYKKKLIEMIEENNLGDRVFLAGYQDNVKGILKLTDAIVHCPIIDDSLPRVVLEGYALRNIVIATKVGGIPEMVSDGYDGFLIEVGSDALADKIDYVYKNRYRLEKLKDNALKTLIDRFSLEKQIYDLEVIYKRVIGK
jgi:glycosyltransferase involved in cell wall biosynthesis